MANEKIKIKTIFGTHQIYQEILNHPPKNVEYLGASEKTKRGEYYEKKKMKEYLGKILQKLKMVRFMVIRDGDFDIIHSSRGIIPITRKPWVIDMEHVHSFFGLNDKLIKKKFWKKFLERKLASKECKAILCHCEATRQSFYHYLDCSKFEQKLKVLYPSSHIIPIKKIKSKKIRLLAVLSLFEQKGGLQILEAFSKLEKKHNNIELTIRADVPDYIKKKYNSKNIKYQKYFGNIISRERLLKTVYSEADILIYTTFCDSFGYSLIDAMVAGLPIIGTNLFAVPEVVTNGKNGLIVNIPGYNLQSEYKQFFDVRDLGKNENRYVKDLEKLMEKLIKNKKLREKMGKNSFNKIKNGIFSIEERNKKLSKIYQDALK